MFPCRSNFPFDKSVYCRHHGWVFHYATGRELRSHLRTDDMPHTRVLHIERRLGSDEWFDEVGRTSWRWPGQLLSHIIGPGAGKGKCKSNCISQLMERENVDYVCVCVESSRSNNNYCLQMRSSFRTNPVTTRYDRVFIVVWYRCVGFTRTMFRIYHPASVYIWECVCGCVESGIDDGFMISLKSIGWSKRMNISPTHVYCVNFVLLLFFLFLLSKQINNR